MSLTPKKHFGLTLEHINKYLAKPSFLPQKAIFQVQIEPSCDFPSTAGLDLTWPSFFLLNFDDGVGQSDGDQVNTRIALI